MPLQKKNTILAALTAAVFLLGFLVSDPFLLFEKSYEKSAPLIKSKADRVKKVTVTDNTGKRVFTRTTDGWSLELAGSPLGVLTADVNKIETGLKNIFEARRLAAVVFGIEKPLENVVPAGSVAASPVCLVANDVPRVSRVEPHVAEVSKDFVIDQTIVNPENADFAAEGQSSEVVVDSSQPSQENILVSCEEQQPEDSDTEGKSFFSNSAAEVFLIHFV